MDVFQNINDLLLSDVNIIVTILEHFGFYKVTVNTKEIRCGFEYGSNPTAIVIKLINNNNLFVKDYRNNLSYSFIVYLIKSKNIPFKEVISEIYSQLKIDKGVLLNSKKLSLFGGWYDSVGRKVNEIPVKTYPDSILDRYDMTPNERWLKDGITIEAQRFYQVGYDVESQRIVFPIRSAETGEVIAIKGRRNYSTDDESDPKYIYLVPGPMSQTLFNYAESYGDLYNNEVWIVESEKTCMALYGFGYRNVVALGSHTLSEKQAQLILQLNPKKVIMALDEGLAFEETEKNLRLLQTFTTLRDLEFWYWDSTVDQSIKNTKISPSDLGQEYFEKVKNEQLKRWRGTVEKII